MYKQDYEVKLTGVTPLLMHNDNLSWADELKTWREANRKVSVKGDDRSPAWSWIGSLYHDGKVIAVPGDNVMRCLMEGGSMVSVPGGRSGKTFKAQTQSGLISQPFWELLVNGSVVDIQPITEQVGVNDFPKHNEVAASLGFMLFLKRAKIGQQRHVRVRPRFDNWATTGVVTVTDEQITEQVLLDILANAGRYKGLCDWRPGSKTPGPFGMFSAEVERL